MGTGKQKGQWVVIIQTDGRTDTKIQEIIISTTIIFVAKTLTEAIQQKKTTPFEISGALYHTTTISLIIITHYLGVQDSSVFTRITPYKQNLNFFLVKCREQLPSLISVGKCIVAWVKLPATGGWWSNWYHMWKFLNASGKRECDKQQ